MRVRWMAKQRRWLAWLQVQQARRQEWRKQYQQLEEEHWHLNQRACWFHQHRYSEGWQAAEAELEVAAPVVAVAGVEPVEAGAERVAAGAALAAVLAVAVAIVAAAEHHWQQAEPVEPEAWLDRQWLVKEPSVGYRWA